MASSLQSLVTPGLSSRKDFPLRSSSMALLIVDIQDEFTKVEPTSKDYKHTIGFPQMIKNTKRVLELVRMNRQNRANTGSEVIFTYLEALTDDSRDVSMDYKLSGDLLSSLPNPSNPATFLPGISPIAGQDICLPKTSCSVFQSTKLEYILRNLQVEQLLVVGQLTDQCVESAVRDAADLGFFVTVVDDACAANSAACHEKGMHGMKGFCRRLTTDQVLHEISGYDEVNGEEEKLSLSTAGLGKQQCASGAVVIPKPFEYVRDKDKGIQSALLRSLRAAGVKFVRFTIVDAYNTLRCKAVPLSFLIEQHTSHPMTSPTSIAKVCIAGLPTTSKSLIY
jgi:ureidoacrylate peracid hydrolase